MLAQWLVWLGLAGCAPSPAPEPVAAVPPPAPTSAGDREPRERRGGGRRRAGGGRDSERFTPQGPLPGVPDPCGAWEKPGLYEYDFPFGGETTPTLVYIPDSPGPRRMAVVLHGGLGVATDILEQTNILRLADQRGMVVVAPTGSGSAESGKATNWNWRDNPGMERDDVRYLDALVRALRGPTCSRQVLGVGFSNGSMMTMRWLCQGDTPDAGLTAAGRMGVPVASCKGPRPHRNYVGTDDDQYNLEGPTTPQSMDLWANVNGCKGAAKEDRSGSVTTRRWDGCRAPTLEYVIEGFPHAWPRPGAKGDAPMDAMTQGWSWFLEVVP